MVAQLFAVEHPSCVAPLILCDPTCEINPPQAKVLEEQARAVEKGGVRAIVASTMDRWFSPGFPRLAPMW